MSNAERWNPTERFTGLADCYARHRPSYPATAIDCLLRECGLTPNSTVADVGCGTGISTRLLAERGLYVIGVEPNAEMLTTAKQTPMADNRGSIGYRQAKAEETGLECGWANAVTAFQSFHWFNGPAALAEFHRILRPNGWLALMWNDRDATDPLGSAYHQILNSTTEGRAIAASWRNSSDILYSTTLFDAPRTFTFTSEQVLDEEGLIGRALSASYAPREPALVEKMKLALRDVFARSQVGGSVRMRYQVSLYLAKRKLGT